MRAKQIDKLYAQLRPEEQATLAFEAVVRLDEKEADAILACVEWRNYKSIHADYRKRIIGLSCLAQTYALEHFRARCIAFEAFKFFEDSGFKDETLASLVHDAYVRLANLEIALERLGKEYRFDTNAVKRFGHCIGITDPDHLADAEENGIKEACDSLTHALAVG